MTDVAELLGATREAANTELKEVLALETRLANVSVRLFVCHLLP